MSSAQQLGAGRGHAVFTYGRQPCNHARALGVTRDAGTQCPQQRHQRLVAELVTGGSHAVTARDSVLGTYSITEEGETTLDAPLAAYRVEDGEVLPAR